MALITTDSSTLEIKLINKGFAYFIQNKILMPVHKDNVLLSYLL